MNLIYLKRKPFQTSLSFDKYIDFSKICFLKTLKGFFFSFSPERLLEKNKISIRLL